MTRLTWLLSLPLAVFFAGCDSTPAPPSVDAQPPLLSDLSVSPQAVRIADLPPSQVQNGQAAVSLTMAVTATDADADLETVAFVVQSPRANEAAVAEGFLTATGSRYMAAAEVSLPTAITGNYTVLVYGVDAQGNLSNQMRGTLTLSGSLGPPVITTVDAPDRVTRPAQGDPPVSLQIVATVTDPDGLDNILSVELDGLGIQLCDDGGGVSCGGFDSGDATAGDGKFTVTLQVDASNAPGPNTFTVIATDRSGGQSDPVSVTITLD